MLRFTSLLFLVTYSVLAFAQQGKAWEKVRSQYDKGRIYAGIRTCTKQLSGKTPQYVFLVPRAEGHNRIGSYDKALHDAREAMRHVEVEQARNAALELGIAMINLGRPDSARYYMERALGSTYDTRVHYRLGVLDLAEGQHASAMSQFDRVLEKDPDHVQALRERGGVHAALGDTASARRDIEKALALAPRDPANWNSRGYHVHAAAGRHKAAIADYDKAIKLDPNYSFAFNNRGWSWYQLGDRDRAQRNITMAGRKNSGNPFVYRNLGLIALDSGEKERACAHFRMALELRFTALHGDEVEQLQRTHCAGQVPVVPAIPDVIKDGPSPKDPKSNAPVRSNAP